ncbi:hypothetical protein KJ953_03310 [Patescibacteria group bacterium]|nr:hypothetical protein [Patescibacteria group bacterium]MBU1256633.1 hypothetical protein [Patescibacteria group bacterium]MBU1457137.1 hypothetical protein [Patescibacteria group bacterium]
MLKKLPTKLPTKFKTYFWDTDFEALNPQKHPQFVLKRLLDHGNTPAVRWSLKHYSKQDIKNLLTSTRDLSHLTANFWTKQLELNPTQVLCLNKPSTQPLWKH